LIAAFRQRQPGTPIWRIFLWDFIQTLCYIGLVVFYRHRSFGVQNIPFDGPLLLVCNHQSFLDPPIVGAGCHRRQFVALARSTLFNNPIAGWLLYKLNTIPVNQGESDLGAMRLCIEKLKQGHALLVFPEGARTLSGKVEPFETGTMLIIKRAKPMVMPVALDGAYDVWKRGSKLKLRGQVGVMFGKPIPAEQIIEMGTGRGLAFLRDEVNKLRNDLAGKLDGTAPRPKCPFPNA
jgi:1-acyl-sn-glycerol-3-phosphate acyltransferase